MPTEEDFGSFKFKIYRPNLTEGTPEVLDPAGNIAVLLWMPSMGHGSSPVKVERLDVDTFRASKVFFSMKGQWEIRFQVKDGNELKDQASVSITF